MKTRPHAGHPRRDHVLGAKKRAALTPQRVVEELQALKPFIAANMRKAERLRVPPRAVWRAIKQTGFLYLTMAKRHGGLEASFDEMLDAAFAICEADPATGWLAAFAVMNPRSAAAFSPEAQAELFENQTSVVLTSLLSPYGKAERAEGGWRVSGTWFWGTTIELADWVSVTAVTEEPGAEPKLAAFLMPASEVIILDTWNAHGLIATGTHKVQADSVFVPDHRKAPHSMMTPGWMAEIRKQYDYRLFLGDLAPSLSLTICTPLVGMARGALALYREHLARHVRRGADGTDSEKAPAQIRLAKAAGMVSAAELLLRDAARRIYAHVDAEPELKDRVSLEERGRIAYASQLAREAVLFMTEGAGTSAHDLDAPFQQFVRDIVVGATHVAVDADSNLENAGRAMLGLKPLRPSNPRMA